ncbi:MAG: tail fiber domain-containing protein, partial [Ilumatobacteraceae bacterium]
TERARITAGGYFKASNTGAYLNATGTYHEFRNSVIGTVAAITTSASSYTANILYIDATATAAGTGFGLISAQASGVEQFRVRGDGTIFAQNTTVQSLSDARLKDNVVDATDGLNVITALRPVRFDWKSGYGNDRTNQLGFIAQEVEAVFPEAVSEWAMDEPTGEVDEDGKPITEKVDYKTVGPGALIPVLVKAIQELEARIAVLEAQA